MPQFCTFTPQRRTIVQRKKPTRLVNIHQYLKYHIDLYRFLKNGTPNAFV
jgi:hypothetical protein